MRAQHIARLIFFRLWLPPPSPFPLSLQRFANKKSASFLFVSTMSSTSSTRAPAKIRVVSYNLLSSKLARPSHFTRTSSEHLDFENRLPLVLAKLDEAMNRGFCGGDDAPQMPALAPPTIFSLQEVCYNFASALHAFFAQRGYHFVTGLYGRPFNGYMGVGIAYPLKYFDTVNVDVCRLSDERPGGWPREKIDEDENSVDAKGPGVIQKITRRMHVFAVQTVQAIIDNHITKRLGFGGLGDNEVDPWKMSENRFNVLLTVVLRFQCKHDGKSSTFGISNYHMPCAFYAPAVMNVHCEMAVKRVQNLAVESRKSLEDSNCSGKMIPHLFAGDFNILPGSSHYELITTGKLDKSDPTYPREKHGVEWKIESLPMDSAYYALSGSEPQFTNFAHVKEDPEPFIGTLDYIFLSQKHQTSSVNKGNEEGEWWKVHKVQMLPCREDSGGPFPNEKEPSDHLLISADLELISA